MGRAAVCVGILLALAAAAVAAAETDVDPVKLLEEVRTNYQKLDVLEAEGHASSKMDQPQVFEMGSTFSIRLKKPRLYRIAWTMEMPFGPAMDFAVWNAGEGPYFYMGMQKVYHAMPNDVMALAAATGASQTAAFELASLFFEWEDLESQCLDVNEPKLAGTETIEGQECYVVAAGAERVRGEGQTIGPAVRVTEHKLWISKERRLLVKTSQTLKVSFPEKAPEPTDEMLDELLGQAGQEVSDQAREEAREMLTDMWSKMPKGMTSSTAISLVYRETKTDGEFEPKDFAYELPEGTVLTDGFPGMPAGVAP